MVEKIIDSGILRANIRKRKAWGDENVLWVAPQGTPFEVTDDTTSSTWSEGTFLLDGQLTTGFVYHTVVRDPVSEVREDLMRECIRWFDLFDHGTGHETVSPYKEYVGRFWKALGKPWDGGDTDQYWSAAFISYVVRIVGGYTGFKFNQAHAKYIHQAIKRREAHQDGPFWGYRLHEKKPELGDMICLWRKYQTTYDDAHTQDQFPSHCDIVVRVKDGKAHTIGGNVGQSVSHKIFTLTPDGYLPPNRNAFAILKNRR